LSTQPTPIQAAGLTAAGVIAYVDVPGIQANVATGNAAKIAKYHNDVSNWLESLTQATSALSAGPPPSPITVTQVNTLVLQNLITAWNNNLANGVPYQELSLAPAFSQMQYPVDPRIAQALTPVQAPTQPANPVGAALGGGYFADVTGDTNPVGAVVVNLNGTFVKVGANTPFGPETEYLEVQPVQSAFPQAA